MNHEERLIVLPSLRAPLLPDGRVIVTRKFLEGMAEYAAHWDGPVQAVLEPCAAATDNLDNVTVVPAELPFDLHVLAFDDERIAERIAAAAVVLGGADHRQNHLAGLCRKLGTAYVVNTEYSLQTRKQIAAAEERNPLRRWRRYVWESGQERAVLRSIDQAAGVQCNGLPTYAAYRDRNPRTLLYFDTRTTADLLPDEESLAARLAPLVGGAPLRLLFSGRLIAMKGADHLPRFAAELRRRGVPFVLTICGAGALEAAVRKEVAESDLAGKVIFKGALDFKTQLLPLVKREIDLFVCPHRQGDPSCTYLETLACGVPIVGYANEAWSGLAALGDFGSVVPLDDPAALARAVARLHDDRETLARRSLAAWQFAVDHTFEQTFLRRIEHLRQCASIESRQVASVE